MVLEHQRFRLLTEYYSFLYWNKKQTLLNFREEFPSPCGVLFILIRIRKKSIGIRKKARVSVSLWSIIHSYMKNLKYTKENLMFPSPYGVSFILIRFFSLCYDAVDKKFPSPYGVSFILISIRFFDYPVVDYKEFPSPCGVSFILISIRFFDYPVVDYKEFPSPCGVSFILIGNNIRIINSHIFKEKFPSPYGVLFILMKKKALKL